MEKTQEKPACKICGDKKPLFLCDTFNGHSSTRQLSHYRCSSCGLVFVGNKISNDELGEAYSTLDSSSYYEEIHNENLKKMEFSAREMLSFSNKSARVIDIGTGNGMFLKVLHDAGFENVSGHEIAGEDLSGVKDIAENIYQDFDYQTIPSETFDVVTLLDVVEHVVSPHYLLENAFRILKPGGYVYFHTPVVTRTDRMMHKFLKVPALNKIPKMWQMGRTSVFHLQNYSERSLEKLLKDCSFTNIDIKVKNELSWNVSTYVRVYLTDKIGLPKQVAPVLSPIFYPFLATDLLNSNKSIVKAQKPLTA